MGCNVDKAKADIYDILTEDQKDFSESSIKRTEQLAELISEKLDSEIKSKFVMSINDKNKNNTSNTSEKKSSEEFSANFLKERQSAKNHLAKELNKYNASTPLEDVSIGHLYATDSAPQYVGSLGGIKDTKANPETVFNAFFELIGNALFKSGRADSKINRRKDIADFTKTKYLVENKILNDEIAKSKIMKRFDTMINKKVSDNARTEINNIIEKLVNCKP